MIVSAATIMNKAEYTLNILIFNGQLWTITGSISDLKIGYDTAQSCAHVCQVSHYIDGKKKYVAKPSEKLR